MSITLYHIALVTHIIGITVMAGTSFIDFVAFRILCKAYPADNVKVLIFKDYLYSLQRFLGLGMLLILVSGVAMMIKFHEIWGAQLWFRIKMGILLLIIVNGLVLRRRVGSTLKKITVTDGSITTLSQKWDSVRRNMTAIQLVQILLFVIIYVLSVFKFN